MGRHLPLLFQEMLIMSAVHAPVGSPADEMLGRVINERFRVVELVARGGMGRVYRAEQLQLGRSVALKVMSQRLMSGEHERMGRERFLAEASIAARLQHANTVTVFDYGCTAEGMCFIAMELVTGRSLREVIRSEAPLPVSRVVHIAQQIA